MYDDVQGWFQALRRLRKGAFQKLDRKTCPEQVTRETQRSQYDVQTGIHLYTYRYGTTFRCVIIYQARYTSAGCLADPKTDRRPLPPIYYFLLKAKTLKYSILPVIPSLCTPLFLPLRECLGLLGSWRGRGRINLILPKICCCFFSAVFFFKLLFQSLALYVHLFENKSQI